MSLRQMVHQERKGVKGGESCEGGKVDLERGLRLGGGALCEMNVKFDFQFREFKSELI